MFDTGITPAQDECNVLVNSEMNDVLRNWFVA
jgi:hypothetical protein